MERSVTEGMMAIIKTRTPIPPTQWVKRRHISTPWGMDSTSVITDAPVVVKPLTVSKKASKKLGSAPLSTKGIQPIRDRAIQAKATITKPSLA